MTCWDFFLAGQKVQDTCSKSRSAQIPALYHRYQAYHLINLKLTTAPVLTDEPDIAVFRFTLGIPGFDDADIPRILGFAALALLAVNNVLNDATNDASQVSPTAQSWQKGSQKNKELEPPCVSFLISESLWKRHYSDWRCIRSIRSICRI